MMTAEEHYEQAVKYLPPQHLPIPDELKPNVGVARVHALLATYRLMADTMGVVEHVQRFAEGLASNPLGSELHDIGDELQAIVGHGVG